MAQKGLIIAETGTQRLVGYVVDIGQGDGRARCSLTIGAQHLNRHGVLHGGIVATLLDNAMGVTASLTADPSGSAPFLTISMTTQFLAPAREGAQITATGRVTGGGRKVLFVEGDLKDAGGELISTASGVFKKVPTAPAS